MNKKEEKIDEIVIEENFEEKLKGLILKENQNVKWEDIVGLEKAKNILKEAIIFPKKFSQLFKNKRKSWKSILLYGTSGTGKTYLTKALITEIYDNYTFFSVSNRNYGINNILRERPKFLQGLFKLAKKITINYSF